MNKVVEAAKQLYIKEYKNAPLVKQLQSEFSPSISRIEYIFSFLFYRILNEAPMKYWNKNAAHQVFDKLESCLKSSTPENQILSIDEEVFEHFIMGYSAYEQISETWTDIHDFNIAPETKTRLYRLPIYTSIIEGCLSNLLRFLSYPLSKYSGKDYTVQNKLRSLLGMAKSNGLNEITDYVDVNLRNAINHGKVSIQRKGGFENICFYYYENNQSRMIEMRLYEFDQIIDNLYDMVSGLLMGIALFINQHISVLNIDETKKGYIPFTLLAMELSTPVTYCSMISDVENHDQINVEMAVINYNNRDQLIQLAIILSILVYNRYNDYKKYYIGFSHPRMMTGFMRFSKEQLTGIIDETISLNEVVNQVLKNDSMLFQPSSENLNYSDYKYFCFPNYSKNDIIINNLKDVSLEDRKRLRAYMFLGEEASREAILKKIETAIEWLKTVKNPPNPKLQLKHGNMPADSIYLNVYRYDNRRNKDLLPSNDNFVCFVDYNKSGNTSLKFGGLPKVIWNNLHHETVGCMQISWREKGKLTQHNVNKVGRNDPCPCGSGKKYKYCCGK